MRQYNYQIEYDVVLIRSISERDSTLSKVGSHPRRTFLVDCYGTHFKNEVCSETIVTHAKASLSDSKSACRL